MKKRYQVWIGPYVANRHEVATLTECFKMVYSQGYLNSERRDIGVEYKRPERIRVFDSDPGWLHPIYDSKEDQ